MQEGGSGHISLGLDWKVLADASLSCNDAINADDVAADDCCYIASALIQH